MKNERVCAVTVRGCSAVLRAVLACTLVLPMLWLAGCGGSSSSTTPPPLLAFVNGQAASVVIGQPDMDTGTDHGAGANTIGQGRGNPMVQDGRLYLGDQMHNRVLGFEEIPEVNDALADFVLGQPDFTSTAQDTTDATFHYPLTVSGALGRMTVADNANHRVMLWNIAPVTGNPTPPADVVLGQADKTSSAFGCSQTGLYAPESVLLVGLRLIVADTLNHRVLVWNTLPDTDGAPADLVLGHRVQMAHAAGRCTSLPASGKAVLRFEYRPDSPGVAR
jgi:hypothetical protein